MKEEDYILGSQSAWRSMLGVCLNELGIHDIEAERARWVAERTDLILLLRRLCDELGDNDWSDDLSLVDVIEKHLIRHIVQ